MKKVLTAAVLLCLVLSMNAFSQSSNATLGGTVQDSTGAFIPGVTVTATNNATGVVATILTNEAGAYNFASLQPGTYDVKADLAGFQPAIAKAFELGGSQQARFNFTLLVGSTTTAIDVTASADTILATSSNSVGTVLPEYKVRDLPKQTGNVFNLVKNTAGVSSGGGFAGGGQSTINPTRDGINVSDGRYENGAWSVTYTSSDLVEEVKVIIAPVDAETSRGSGQVAMVTRSGGNAFKGSAFWNNHNSALDASSWFNNFNGVGKSFDNRNQYGARLAGPIIKNKTFFFALFEGQRDMKRTETNGTTLTDMARAGIFRYFPGVDPGNASSTNPSVDRNGNPVSPAGATGPLSAIDLFGNCTYKGAAVANCKTYRDPLRNTFSTNPFILEEFKRMPSPNQFTGGDGLNTAQIHFVRKDNALDLTCGDGDEVDRDEYNARIDHNFNSKHKLSLIGTKEHTWGSAAQAGQRSWPLGFDGLAVKRPFVYTIQFTSTLSSSLLNQVRLGKKASFNWQWGAANRGDDIGAQARALVGEASGIKYNTTFATGIPTFAPIGGFGRWREGINPFYSAADDLSWSHGKHGFKMGYEFRQNQSNGFNDPNYDPVVTLSAGSNAILGLDSTAYTGLGNTPAGNARNLLIDLSGSVGSINQAFGVVSASKPTLVGTPLIRNNAHWNIQSEGSAFFKDDWKFSKDVTLNLGIHWEWYGQPFEHNGLAARIIDPDPTAYGKVTCTDGRATNTQSTCSNLVNVQFVGKNSPNPNILTNRLGNDNNNFAPSFGFSWNVPWFGQGKTVLRAGYGISFSGALRNFIGVDGVIGTVPGINLVSGGSGITYTPTAYTTLSAVTLPIPFPSGTPTTSPFTLPTTRSLGINTYNHVSPYTENWNVEIQREVAKNTTVEIRYIGTAGKKIWGTVNENSIDTMGRSRALFDAFVAVRAGGDSPLLTQILMGQAFGSGKTVNGTTWTGAQAVRTSTTTRAAIANGNVATFVSTLNTTTVGGLAKGDKLGSDGGSVLRYNGFPENYIVPSPQYTTATMEGNLTNSTYNSLQLQVSRRLFKGFTNTTAWTWSKSIGAAPDISPSKRGIEKVKSGSAGQITSNGTYELPFGTNHFLLGGAPGWAQNIIHGWQLGGIMNYRTGSPMSLTSGITTIGTTGSKPNIMNGGFPQDAGKIKKVANGVVYYDGYTTVDDPYKSSVSTLDGLSTAYNNRALCAGANNVCTGPVLLVNPNPGEYGNMPAATHLGPSSIGFDADLIKRFKIHESKEFEFRLDAINILNHPNFGNPTTSINSTSSFGVITSASGSRSFIVNSRINF